MSEPWEPLVDEPTRAFAAFCRYRDLAPDRRSLLNAAALACELPVPVDLGKLSDEQRRAVEARKRAYERWSSAHSWVIRAKEWDAYNDTERLADRDRQVSTMIDRQAELGRILQNRAMSALIKQGTDQRAIGDKRGDRVVLAFAIEGARLERMAYGLAADDPSVDVGLTQEETREALEGDPEVAEAMARLAMAQARAVRRTSGVASSTIEELAQTNGHSPREIP